MAAPRFTTPVNPKLKKLSRFIEFSPYENGRVRYLKFNVNALADFEQETGMGFAQLMKQRAIFASARAMLWAGLKHEDRALTIETVGDLLSDYLRDPDVPEADPHTVDSILMVAINAAVEQGALGRYKETPPETLEDEKKSLGDGADPNALDGVVLASEPTPPNPTPEN